MGHLVAGEVETARRDPQTYSKKAGGASRDSPSPVSSQEAGVSAAVGGVDEKRRKGPVSSCAAGAAYTAAWIFQAGGGQVVGERACVRTAEPLRAFVEDAGAGIVAPQLYGVA